MADDRKRALALGAPALGDVLTAAGYAWALNLLTANQRIQLQRYIDAAVVDPAVAAAANAALRQGTRIYGSLSVTDPAAQRQSDKIMRDFIRLGQFDDSAKLDLSKLLDPKALAPITDNPDEAAYLAQVRKWLESSGVWLRLAPKLTHDPDDRSRWINDGKHFDVWISLGSRGDGIPVKSGVIDRDALLRTQAIGANYWTYVDQGPVQQSLERQIRSLSDQIQDGMALHIEIARIRREAATGVVAVSDFIGGADFPDIDIWSGPNAILVQAMTLRNKGRVWGANALLVIAAASVRNTANALNTYIAKSQNGAASSVRVLKVARTAGKVAEAGLLVASGAALVTGAGAAAGIAATDAAVDAAAEKELAKYVARNPEIAGELKTVKVLPGPKGTVSRAGQGAGTGWNKW